MEAADIIFVCGGNSFYLLQESIRSEFAKFLPELLISRIYIGSSAGVVILGPTIDPLKYLDDPKAGPELSSHDALGMIPFVPLVHYGKDKYLEKYKNTFDEAYSLGVRVVSISDDEFLVVEGDSVRWGN